VIERLLEWTNTEALIDTAESRRLGLALEGGEVDLVADTIVRRATRAGREQDMIGFLADVFQEQGNPLPDRYTQLRQLGLSAALTTSFDPLLKQTFSIPEHEALTPADTEALLGRLSSKEPFVGKLYGRLSAPNSVLLSPSQYEEAVVRNEAFGQFMESLFVSRTLLFLGCSLRGILDYLGGIRIPGSGRRHYALLGVEGAVWETKATRMSSVRLTGRAFAKACSTS